MVNIQSVFKKISSPLPDTAQQLPVTVTEPQGFGALPGGNRIEGTPQSMRSSKLVFKGQGNTLVIEDGVKMDNCEIVFNGDDSIVYLRRSRHICKLNASLNHNSVLYIGRDTYMNGVLHVILSEQKHFFVGDEGLFSFDIWVRTADPHLIYDCDSMARINPSQSIYLGDHVWVGQSVLLLKGTQVDSGTIIGAGAVLSGKKIPHNAVWAGNPPKEIKSGIFWERSCVHSWQDADTARSQDFREYAAASSYPLSPEEFLYRFDPMQQLPFEELEAVFSARDTEAKLRLLRSLSEDGRKNRFVHSEP